MTFRVAVYPLLFIEVERFSFSELILAKGESAICLSKVSSPGSERELVYYSLEF